MLSTFSCSYWPPICRLWRNVCLGLLSIFNWIVFHYWAARAIGVFWKVSPCQVTSFADSFSQSIHTLSCLLFMIFVCCENAAKLDSSHLFLFSFLLCWETDLRERCCNLWVFCLFLSILRFWVSCVTFKSLSHFEFIFADSGRMCLTSLMYTWLSSCPNNTCWGEAVFFPWYIWGETEVRSRGWDRRLLTLTLMLFVNYFEKWVMEKLLIICLSLLDEMSFSKLWTP